MNPMTKNNNNALSKGKDLITTSGRGGAGRHGIFSKSIFLEGTSIISPMYIKLSAVTDTAINGSLKYIIINPFQAIVPQNNTQISFILT